MKVILASKSPRRKELMNLLNIPYEIMESSEQEVYDKNKECYEQCVDIGYHKALNIYEKTKGERIIIGSDTIVVYDNKIYGKPQNRKDAFLMLKKFSNNYHEVITSYSILIYKNNQYYEEKGYTKTKIYVDEITNQEIDDWLNLNKYKDKAGSYAIQEEFAKHIKKIDGDYFSVIGFPLNKVYNVLKKYL